MSKPTKRKIPRKAEKSPRTFDNRPLCRGEGCIGRVNRHPEQMCGGKRYGGKYGCGRYFCDRDLFQPLSACGTGFLCASCLHRFEGS